MMRLFERPWAGLALGPAAWAADTQANYAAAAISCRTAFPISASTASACALIALGGALISWRAWQHLAGEGPVESPRSRQPGRFLAGIGMGLGVLFALVIVTQGTAAVVLAQCLR